MHILHIVSNIFRTRAEPKGQNRTRNFYANYGIEKGDRIFYFTKPALDKEIKRIAAKAGLPIIRVHNLRHSHASMLIEMGLAPLEIAEK